jgi:hypothetical protein
MPAGFGAQLIEHHARFHAGTLGRSIYPDDPSKILGNVYHDRHVCGLSGEPGSAAAKYDWRAESSATRKNGFDIVEVPRNDHADRNFPVICRGGGIDRTGAGVEPHFPADSFAEISGETRYVDIRGFAERAALTLNAVKKIAHHETPYSKGKNVADVTPRSAGRRLA